MAVVIAMAVVIVVAIYGQSICKRLKPSTWTINRQFVLDSISGIATRHRHTTSPDVVRSSRLNGAPPGQDTPALVPTPSVTGGQAFYRSLRPLISMRLPFSGFDRQWANRAKFQGDASQSTPRCGWRRRTLADPKLPSFSRALRIANRRPTDPIFVHFVPAPPTPPPKEPSLQVGLAIVCEPAATRLLQRPPRNAMKVHRTVKVSLKPFRLR